MATSYALRISERKGIGAGVDVTPSSDASSPDDDDHHLRFPTSRDARQDLFCLIAKQCVAQGQGLVNGGQGSGPLRLDLVLALLDASASPSPELLAHAIACLALAGMHLQVSSLLSCPALPCLMLSEILTSSRRMHLQALAYEPLFAAAMEQQPRFSPPYWGLTFLLYSAAQKGYGNTARRLLQVSEYPSPLAHTYSPTNPFLLWFSTNTTSGCTTNPHLCYNLPSSSCLISLLLFFSPPD